MAKYISKIKINNIIANIRDTNAHTLISNLTNTVNTINTTLSKSIESNTNKLNNLDIVNVKDYGAVGDGITDDTEAFENAINAVPIHGTLYIPLGCYILSRSLNIRKPMTIYGVYTGWDNQSYTKEYTVDDFIRPLLKSSALTGINCTSLGLTLKNVAIEMLSNNANTVGVNIDNSATLSSEIFNRFNIVDNVTVQMQYGGGTGFYVKFSGLTRFYNCLTSRGITGYFFGSLDDTHKINTSLVLEGCWAINYTVQGYRLNDCLYSSLLTCAADSRDGAYGYVLVNCNSVSLVSCGCELSKTGYYIVNSYSCSVSGMYAPIEKSENGILIDGNAEVRINDFTITRGSSSTFKPLSLTSTCIVLVENTNIETAYVSGVSGAVPRLGKFALYQGKWTTLP